jgi:sugar phosphate isomerase/epimerase
LVVPPVDPAIEASSDRLLPGTGGFDLPGFIAALPAQCPLSVEIPRDALVLAGVSASVRAQQAAAAVRDFLAD